MPNHIKIPSKFQEKFLEHHPRTIQAKVTNNTLTVTAKSVTFKLLTELLTRLSMNYEAARYEIVTIAASFEQEGSDFFHNAIILVRSKTPFFSWGKNMAPPDKGLHFDAGLFYVCGVLV